MDGSRKGGLQVSKESLFHWNVWDKFLEDAKEAVLLQREQGNHTAEFVKSGAGEKNGEAEGVHYPADHLICSIPLQAPCHRFFRMSGYWWTTSAGLFGQKTW